MALICDLCDGSDFVKEDGMFVCRSCGTKYTIEEAKKMMNGTSGGGSSAPAPASNASAEKIANMLTLAENAFEQANNSQAEDYANKVLEIDGSNALAWLIKGEAVGWQSKINNVRFSEMVSCFKFALQYADDEQTASFKEIMADQSGRLCKALINLTADNFAKYPSKDNVSDISNALQSVISLQVDLLPMFVFLDSESVHDSISLKLNDAAVAASNYADSEFGPDNSDKTKYSWELYMDRNDNALTVLEKSLAMCESEVRITTLKNNYRIIQNNVINSCSYKFEVSGYWSGYVKDYSLTANAISIRNRMISDFNTKATKKLNEIQEKKRKKEKEEREKKEKAQREKNERYWAAHAEEKAALEGEKQELQKQVNALDQQITEMDRTVTPELNKLTSQKAQKIPEELAVAEQSKLISSLEAQRDSLGIFKGKEKKAITARLEETEQPKLKQLKEEATKARKEFDAQINAKIQEVTKDITKLRMERDKKKTRIKEIDTELTKPR